MAIVYLLLQLKYLFQHGLYYKLYSMLRQAALVSNLDWLTKELQLKDSYIIGRNPSMVIPSLTSQDLTPIYVKQGTQQRNVDCTGQFL